MSGRSETWPAAVGDPAGPAEALPVKTRVLDGFDDPAFGADAWNVLLHTGDTDVVSLTWQWQRAWWKTMGRGHLLLIVAERGGRPVAVAPFYADSGMVFFVGSGSADYMDVVGDVSDPAVLDLLLDTARAHVPGFVGFRLYCVLETSRTGALLQGAARRLDLECYEEKRWPAPVVDLATDPARVRAAAGGRPVARQERQFQSRGPLTLQQLTDGDAVVPHLEAFFEQHITRLALAGDRSPFLQRPGRTFLEQLTRSIGETGWLHFSVLEWDGRPIAFEYGIRYNDVYFSGPSSFAVDLAPRFPGRILLRRLLLRAIDEGIREYDLGVGDEPHAFQLATGLRHVCTWGLYPTELLRAKLTRSSRSEAAGQPGPTA